MSTDYSVNYFTKACCPRMGESCCWSICVGMSGVALEAGSEYTSNLTCISTNL